MNSRREPRYRNISPELLNRNWALPWITQASYVESIKVELIGSQHGVEQRHKQDACDRVQQRHHTATHRLRCAPAKLLLRQNSAYVREQVECAGPLPLAPTRTLQQNNQACDQDATRNEIDISIQPHK